MSMVPLAVFGPLDWGVLAAYMALMALIGTLASRKKTDAEGYFLAERRMPTMAVALSVVATSLSVETFNGAPQQTFRGDLTYLSANIGGFIAVAVVATLFIPRLYRAGTVTIYGFIDQRYGETARASLSGMFLLGRLLASGARLFMAGIPICLLLWGKTDPSKRELVIAICLVGVIGTAYTIAGGIRAVIWTDTVQIVIVVGAVVLSIVLLLGKIPLSVGQIATALGEAPGPTGGSKLRLIDLSMNPTADFTLWTALIGATFLNVAAYGVDHDLAQRMLTARSPWRGSLSLVVSQFINLGVLCLFLAVGLLLYVFYQRPDLMGAAAPTDVVADSKQVYPQFLLNHLPAGLKGLAIAGMFAAAQGSLDSAINAMASSAVADLYWPLRRRLGLAVDKGSRAKAPRLAVALMGALLIGVAILAAYRYDPGRDALLPFALGVMAFAYTGMLGVFLAALFTRRGNATSVVAALVTGLVVTTLLQNDVLDRWTWTLFGRAVRLGMFWWMPIGTVASFVVCVAGRGREQGRRA